MAPGIPGLVPVRDSKNSDVQPVVFYATAWTSFVDALKSGAFPQS
ncbi:DUF397 domain-containing protein [Streptomyces sp. ODS28]